MNTREQAVIKAAKRHGVRRTKADVNGLLADIGQIRTTLSRLHAKGKAQHRISASEVYRQAELHDVAKRIRNLNTFTQTLPQDPHGSTRHINSAISMAYSNMMDMAADLNRTNYSAGTVAFGLVNVAADLSAARKDIAKLTSKY